jgi:hypothetical protein
VHRPAGRIEQSDFARILEGAMGNVDGLAEEFLLGEVVGDRRFGCQIQAAN